MAEVLVSIDIEPLTEGGYLATSDELQGLVASPTAWCTAVRHHPGEAQSQARPVHLCRKVMRPRVRS